MIGAVPEVERPQFGQPIGAAATRTGISRKTETNAAIAKKRTAVGPLDFHPAAVPRFLTGTRAYTASGRAFPSPNCRETALPGFARCRYLGRR